MSFVTAEESKNVYTQNGALSYSKPDVSGGNNGRLSLFFKAVRELDSDQLYKYLEDSVHESLVDTFVLCFHLRDSRGGKGERLLGRHALAWLCVNYPIEFISPDSESSIIRKEVIDHLKTKYKVITCMFDNDTAGIKSMEKYKELYNLPSLLLPLEKDLSDSVKKHGQKAVRQILTPLLNGYE